MEAGLSTGDFERWMKGALEMGRVSEEAHWGGLVYWGPWVTKGRLWGWASLFMGTQLGNLEWAHLPETLRDD